MRVKIGDRVVYEVIEGETVLLDLDSGVYFALNQVATRFWRLIEEGKDVEQALETMTGEYEVEPQVLRADIEELLGELTERGLVVAAPEESG